MLALPQQNLVLSFKRI